MVHLSKPLDIQGDGFAYHYNIVKLKQIPQGDRELAYDTKQVLPTLKKAKGTWFVMKLLLTF